MVLNISTSLQQTNGNTIFLQVMHHDRLAFSAPASGLRFHTFLGKENTPNMQKQLSFFLETGTQGSLSVQVLPRQR